MIPQRSDACWRELAAGKRSLETHVLGLQLILKRVYKAVQAGGGDDAIKKGAEEIFHFFEKYQSILVNEINSIRG